MPFTTTTKHALRWLTGLSQVSDIDTGFQALAEDIDPLLTPYLSGTLGARPAASKSGRWYRATDNGVLYLDTGSSWLDIASLLGAGSVSAAEVAADVATQAELDAVSASVTAAQSAQTAHAALTGTAHIIPTVTSLPGSPVDGQVIDYLADGPNGIVWRLRYRAAATAGLRWEFIGGNPLINRINTSETTNNATYVNLATGQFLAPPLSGEYLVEIGCGCHIDTAGQVTLMSFGLGSAAAALDADCVAMGHDTAGVEKVMSTQTLKTLTAGQTVYAAFRRTGGTATFTRRYLKITPRRLG